MSANLREIRTEKLSEAEQSVLQWLIENEEHIPDTTISEIAEASYTSTATVSRTIRKCGFQSLGELKYKISMDLNSTINEIFQRSLTECRQTINAIRVSDIRKVISLIKSASKIYLVARGSTAWIAEDFELQLQVLGFNAYVMSDSQLMKQSERLFRRGHLVIVLTVKNSTPELALTAGKAKEKGAKVVTCCCLPGTPLEPLSDIYICGREANSLIGDFKIISRLPLQIMVRTLVDYLMLEDDRPGKN